jgi:hypothetical protein
LSVFGLIIISNKSLLRNFNFPLFSYLTFG